MDLDARLDPAIAAALDGWSLPAPTRPEDIAAARRQRIVAAAELSDLVERTDHLVPVDPPVPVRVHRPIELEPPLPCVVSMHGGGYMMGSHADDDLRHDRWGRRLGYVGVAVDYRLAPETPYPGPLEDCYTALAWVHAHAAELGVDQARIGLSGFSAGGGLAAGLALLARDRGELPVAFQQLVYPMLDDRRVTPTSAWDVPVWPPASNALGWSCYLGELAGTDDVPPYAAAARATDLAGLPPTFVGVGALDVFCDEDVVFAQRLNQAGVPVELHVYSGAPHAFDMLTGRVDVATRAVRDQREWLAAHL